MGNDLVVDVAVIGYGPTGMMLAALLGQQGHSVVVLERHKGLYNLPRAACFDDEIMRTFQKLGIAEAVHEGAVVQRDYDWINAQGETLVELEYADPAPGGWAALYMMYQPHVETVLDRHLKTAPTVEVRQGFTVTGMAQHADGVAITGSGGAVQARYVVGADGGAGFTRQHVQTSVSDYGFQENWLVCDFEMKRAVPGLPKFRQVCDPAQPTSIVRIGPRHQRFSFMLNPGETQEEATRPDRVWARVGRYLSPGDADLIRVANYVFRSRIADQWRHGRVLLAGDAAHEMPPFLAQGMCSGIRDAHNLAWKLGLVLTGRADAAILDTYQPEREPHVRFITEKAIELGRVQTLRDSAAARARDARLLAQRAAHHKPEKLRYPALHGGLIAGDGTFFPQGAGRADDRTGPGWCIAARDEACLAGVSAVSRTAWAAFGGHVAVADESIADWFAARGCAAAVVRPDWYVYGTTCDAAELEGLLATLQSALQPGRHDARNRQLVGLGSR